MAWSGYGLYWAILEMLRNESTYKLTLNKNTYRAIKMQTGTTIDVEKFITDCINEYRDSEKGNGLFNSKDGMFWSESFLRRMQKYEDLKDKRRQAANARWNKEEEKNKKGKKCKCIKGFCKSNAKAQQKKYKSNAKIKKVYAKKCKLNQIKSNQMKLNKTKLKEMKSIYPSDHTPTEKQKITMDEIEEMEFQRIINNCSLHVLDPNLNIEIEEILREMYFDSETRKKILELNSRKVFYALEQFSIANTKSRIQKPKAYFKKCVLTATEQTYLSTQYDINTMYEMEEVQNE